jgi:hypothetical protein
LPMRRVSAMCKSLEVDAHHAASIRICYMAYLQNIQQHLNAQVQINV